MRVFHRERAGCPLRVLWMLEELGEPYELIVMTREEGRGADHRGRHPLGRVPAIEDDEGVVFESAAICLHLGDRHPESGLLPAPGTHGACRDRGPADARSDGLNGSARPARGVSARLQTRVRVI